MKVFLSLIAVGMLCASSSCTRHTTCSAYGTAAKKVEKNQTELYVNVDNSTSEKI